MGQVVAVARDDRQGFAKARIAKIMLLAGFGTAENAHTGVTVKRR